MPEQPLSGIELIQAERKRQIEREGYSTEHDQHHTYRDLVLAACAYLINDTLTEDGKHLWPWEPSEFKPHGSQRDLVRAGALIAAAIDRLEGAMRDA